MKLGLVSQYFDNLLVGDSQKSFDRAIEVLKSLGMNAQKISIPHASLIPPAHLVTTRVENVLAHERYLRTLARDYSPDILYRHIHALTIPAKLYVKAQKVRRLITEEFIAALKTVNVIVTPVSIPAPTFGEVDQGFTVVEGKKINFHDIRGSYWGVSAIPFNITGLPAILFVADSHQWVCR
jgi:Asp-tRNA(Asn)/Glu-tRNA(Gln) amidotransferase A subunit family amidase